METKTFNPRDLNEYTRIEYLHEGRTYYDCYEASGLMQYMKGHDTVVAIFGQFDIAYSDNTGEKIVRWTVYLGTDKERQQYGLDNWVGCHECSNGEWWDDLTALRNGNVEYC